jgi:hypothetical protein
LIPILNELAETMGILSGAGSQHLPLAAPAAAGIAKNGRMLKFVVARSFPRKPFHI